MKDGRHATLTDTPRGVYTVFMDKKQSLVRRLRIIEGQVRGLQEMVSDGKYCVDVIAQTSAVKQGLSNIEDVLLEHHLSHCLVGQIRSGEKEKATDEILKVYRLKRK